MSGRRNARDAAVREAVLLPLVFLTVALAGGFRATEHGFRFLPPPLVMLLLASMLVALLIRCGVLVPWRLMNEARSPLENLSGLVVICCVFIASAQTFNIVTPEAGLLHFIFSVFFLLLIWNTLAAAPDARRLLHSLMVIFGGALALKYVVLAALYDPDGGLARRVLTTLLEGVSLGTLEYEPDSAPTGYVAFAAIVLYLLGLFLLPRDALRWAGANAIDAHPVETLEEAPAPHRRLPSRS